MHLIQFLTQTYSESNSDNHLHIVSSEEIQNGDRLPW